MIFCSALVLFLFFITWHMCRLSLNSFLHALIFFVFYKFLCCAFVVVGAVVVVSTVRLGGF